MGTLGDPQLYFADASHADVVKRPDLPARGVTWRVRVGPSLDDTGGGRAWPVEGGSRVAVQGPYSVRRRDASVIQRRLP